MNLARRLCSAPPEGTPQRFYFACRFPQFVGPAGAALSHFEHAFFSFLRAIPGFFAPFLQGIASIPVAALQVFSEVLTSFWREQESS